MDSILAGVTYLLYALLGLVCALIGIMFLVLLYHQIRSWWTLRKLGPEAGILMVDGLKFRDLNKTGKLSIYEDYRQPVEARVEDLLSQMTLEEKAGLMMQPMIHMGKGGKIIETPSMFSPLRTSELVVNRKLSHFNILYSGDPQDIAIWYNAMQKMAERTRLGIPVTISTDPRHSATDSLGATIKADGFSQWPDPLGLAATRDANITQQFGDIARQEYLAVGIRTALHPMSDLATEPRWARMSGTFGENAQLSAEMTVAYLRGFQGEKVGKESVSCMVKHFPGGGPQMNGLDAHFPYGREQVYPGNNFDYHLIPFEQAFKTGSVEQIMPYYGIPMDQTSENVGMSFNKEIITDLLRGKYGFKGVVCTDWMICETNRILGLKLMESTSWGVEHLSVLERYEKALNAGVDQFGGQFSPDRVIKLVKQGRISEERINESVRRILRLKFIMGLFDAPYIDADNVHNITGTPEFMEAGIQAQRKSLVLLKNADVVGGRKALPLAGRPKLYIENMNPKVAFKYGELVDAPEKADYAILRLATPYQRPRGRGILERFFHQGDLDFKDEEKERILKIMKTVPTIVDIYMERAAVIPEISEAAVGLFANFNVVDEVVLDAVFGKFNPSAKLPIEMPSSMAAVRKQREDMPSDSENPLYTYGHGLSYE